MFPSSFGHSPIFCLSPHLLLVHKPRTYRFLRNDHAHSSEVLTDHLHNGSSTSKPAANSSLNSDSNYSHVNSKIPK